MRRTSRAACFRACFKKADNMRGPVLAAMGLLFLGACGSPAIDNAGGTPGGGDAGASGNGGTGGSSSGTPDAGFTFQISDGGNVPPPGTGKTCGQQKYKLERVPPEVLLVLDRSESMDLKVPETGNTRW